MHMRTPLSWAAILLATLPIVAHCVATFVASQPTPVDLFEDVAQPMIQPDTSTSSSSSASGGQLLRIVKTNVAPIRGGSERVRLSLTSTNVVTAAKIMEQTIGGFEVWQGESESTNAEKVSLVVMPNGAVYGNTILKTPEGGFKAFEILPVDSDPTKSMIKEVPIANLPGGEPLEFELQGTPDSSPNGKGLGKASRRRRHNTVRQTTQDSGGTVDVMVLYTPAVTAIHGVSNLNAKIALMVADVNFAFYNSQVPLRYNLVHTQEVSYVETGDMSTSLNNLTRVADGALDDVHALRDQYMADLVQLLTTDTDYCGLAWLPPAGTVGNPAWIQSIGFSITKESCMTTFTAAHEWGHNMGLLHNKEDSPTSTPTFPYAYGHRICTRERPGESGMQTVMAYQCPYEPWTKIPYFSNPNVQTLKGQVTGIVDQADNARALATMAWTTANYRVAGVVRIPPVPVYLAATAPAVRQVELKWLDLPDETGYNVFRKLSTESTFVHVGTVAANTVVYTDTTVTPNTSYNYRVSAVNTAGESGRSIPAHVTTPTEHSTEVPVITAVKTSDGTAVVVTIAPLSTSEATTFTIERSTNRAPATTVGTTTASGPFTDSTIQPGNVYVYQVSAVGLSGLPRMSNTQTVVMPLPAPTGLKAAIVDTSATVTWGAVDMATSYAVTWRPTSGPGFLDNPQTSTFTVTAPAATHTITGLVVGTVYEFTVQATNDAHSDLSSTTAKTTARVPVDGIPTITATRTLDGSVLVTIAPPTDTDPTTYRIQRSTNGGAMTDIHNTAATGPYTDTNVAPGNVYVYQVTAVGTSGKPRTSTTQTVAIPLPAPTGLKATIVDTSAAVTWDAVNMATSYVVTWRPTSGPGFLDNPQTSTFTVTAPAATHTITGLVVGTVYEFTVQATNDAHSDLSSTTATTTARVPVDGIPTITATRTLDGSVLVTIAPTTDTDPTTYRIQRSTNGGAMTDIHNTAATEPYTDANVSPGNVYVYQVTAVSTSGKLRTSATETMAIPLPAPTGLSAAVQATSATVTWNKVDAATSYIVTWRPISGQGIAAPGGTFTVPAPRTTHMTTGLKYSTVYEYTVQALGSVSDLVSSTRSTTTANIAPADETPEITAILSNGATAVVVNISPPVLDNQPTVYKIERLTNGGAVQQIGTLAATGSYTDNTIVPGNVYVYQVAAVGSSGKLRTSTTHTVAVPLPAPVRLTATVAGTSITATWTAVNGATDYVVTRQLLSGPGQAGAYAEFKITAPTTTHTSTSLTSGATYEFTVRAISTVSPLVSSAASTKTAKVGTPNPVLKPPSVTCAALSAVAVRVSWAAAAGATGYIVQQLTSTTTPLQGPRQKFSSSTTSASWGTLRPSTTYRFAVYYSTANAMSPPSAICTVTTAKLQASVLSSTSLANNMVGVRWTGVVGATGYTLRRTASSGAVVAINIAAPTSTYVDRRNIVPNQRYVYTITPYYAAGTGPVSKALSVTTPPLLPAVTLTFTRPTSPPLNTVTFRWTVRPGVSLANLKFLVWRRVAGTTTPVLVATLPATARSFTATVPTTRVARSYGELPVAPVKATYQFWVEYENVNGVGAVSSIVSITA